MNRREFLYASGAAATGVLMTRINLASAVLPSDTWRTFEITTEVEILKPAGMSRVWLPVPAPGATPYQKHADTRFDAHGGRAKLVADPATGASMIAAEWAEGAKPALTATSRVMTRDYAVDTTHPVPAHAVDRTRLARYLRPTALLPTDGIVGETAALITKGARTDVDKARAIYDWIVANTFREPTVLGCGTGDIRFMLETNNLGGKCADLNALFVGLARASGLPARDVYGIRVAKSNLGYKSLGASSDVITKAQHCRAEAYLDGVGWTPVDPADVRKVMLEEPPGNLPATDEKVAAARKRLFGSWEMNWVAFNDAHDVALPGSTGKVLPFLMYPQAETAGSRLNPLDPDNLKYRIIARELS